MFVIKSINESQYKYGNVYQNKKDLFNGLSYCCNDSKSHSDRYDTNDCHLYGCSQAFCHGDLQQQFNTIYSLILSLNRIYRTDEKALLKHRVVSFEESDLLSLEELSFIAQQVVDWYALQGFPGFYGIHLNTENPHIHLQIGSVCYFNGNRMHIDFESIMLTKIIGHWYRHFYERLLNDPESLNLRLSFHPMANLTPQSASLIIQKNINWIDKRLYAFSNRPNAYPVGCIYNF